MSPIVTCGWPVPGSGPVVVVVVVVAVPSVAELDSVMPLPAQPEIDRAAWFGLAEAREKILPSQRQILDAVVTSFAS